MTCEIEKLIIYSNLQSMISLLDNLPNTITYLSICSLCNDIKLSNLPSNLKYLYIDQNELKDPLDNLPSSLETLIIKCEKFCKLIVWIRFSIIWKWKTLGITL